jgi:hypothetical protein
MQQNICYTLFSEGKQMLAQLSAAVSVNGVICCYELCSRPIGKLHLSASRLRVVKLMSGVGSRHVHYRAHIKSK